MILWIEHIKLNQHLLSLLVSDVDIKMLGIEDIVWRKWKCIIRSWITFGGMLPCQTIENIIVNHAGDDGRCWGWWLMKDDECWSWSWHTQTPVSWWALSCQLNTSRLLIQFRHGGTGEYWHSSSSSSSECCWLHWVLLTSIDQSNIILKRCGPTVSQFNLSLQKSSLKCIMFVLIQFRYLPEIK